MQVNILPKEYTKDANGIETCQQNSRFDCSKDTVINKKDTE